jgi:hypothetical protein
MKNFDRRNESAVLLLRICGLIGIEVVMNVDVVWAVSFSVLVYLTGAVNWDIQDPVCLFILWFVSRWR